MWMRFVVGLAIVGGLLTVGKWVPLAGIEMMSIADTIKFCTSDVQPSMWPYPVFECAGQQPLHSQIGGQALLGSTALVTFIALWVRRHLAHLYDQ